PRQAPLPQVAPEAATQAGQGIGEFRKPRKPRLAPQLLPLRVVAILLAPARIASGGLKVPAFTGADPHRGPCRRNGQCPDACKLAVVADAGAIGRAVAETATTATPADARLAVVDVAQPGLRGLGPAIGSGRAGVVACCHGCSFGSTAWRARIGARRR